MVKAAPLFETPDYSVRTSDNTKAAMTEYSKSHLEATYESFVAFRQGLRDRGLLPADGVETDEVSFKQERAGTRTIFFRVKPFAEFLADARGISIEEYDISNQPELHLFQAHLQKPAIYGLPLARLSYMFPDDFRPVKRDTFTIIVNGKPEEVVTSSSEGVNHTNALGVLDAFISGISGILAKKGIEPSPSRALNFWALSRFVESGHSVGAKNPKREDENLKALILDLVKIDAPLYTSFLAISSAANPEYKTTRKLNYSAASVDELRDIPKTFLRYMMLNEK